LSETPEKISGLWKSEMQTIGGKMMPDITLCADYTTCDCAACFRRPELYSVDKWQSWSHCKDTELCAGWQQLAIAELEVERSIVEAVV